MNNARIAWIIWCSLWAVIWLFTAFATLGLGLIPMGLSVLAILIPVGSSHPQVQPRPAPPQIAIHCPRCGGPRTPGFACMRCGYAIQQ